MEFVLKLLIQAHESTVLLSQFDICTY